MHYPNHNYSIVYYVFDITYRLNNNTSYIYIYIYIYVYSILISSFYLLKRALRLQVWLLCLRAPPR